MIRPSNTVAACALAVMLGSPIAHADTQVPSLPDRPLGSRTAEPQALAQLQRRLDTITLSSTFACEASYQANKAQAWLNFAKYADHERASSAVQRAAAHHAEALLTQLESGGISSTETPELPTSRHQRDDLWRAVAAAKNDGRLCGAPKMMAYCEVQLAWVDFEAASGGWRHVEPYVRIAEDYCTEALNAAPATASPAEPATEPEAPVAGELPRSVAVEEPEAQATAASNPYAIVLFPHNRSRRADIRAPGKIDLKRLAAQLKSLPADTQISIVGHADITGGPRYNEALSKRRAATVAIQLRQLGVDAARMHVSAVGSEDPVVQCEAQRSPADRRRYLACLEPNRGVVIRLRDR
jgi:outer membrane protein OmpA-like peptidoglycan-associated protein